MIEHAIGVEGRSSTRVTDPPRSGNAPRRALGFRTNATAEFTRGATAEFARGAATEFTRGAGARRCA
jgi:hypothetical protein